MNNLTSDYTEVNALGEILIMLIISFIFGWIARVIWERFFIFINDENSNTVNKKNKKIETKKPILLNKSQKEEIIVPVAKKEDSIKEIIKKEPKIKIAPNGLKNNDLKIVEGIGPKIEILLKNAKINTWDDLAKTKPDQLRMILKEGGDRFAFHDPTTWPEQAMLAAKDQWDELQEFQDFLSGGRQLV